MTRVIGFGGGSVIAVAIGWFAAISLMDTSLNDLVNKYSVKLVPQGTSGTLKVDSPNGSCKKGNHTGCLLFEEGKIGLIRFYLPGSKKTVKTCDNADRVITEIKLTTTPEGGAADAEKGVFAGNLPPWIKDNAFKQVDRLSGVIYAANKDTGETQVMLTNLNSHDKASGEKQFWYEVTVTDCTAPENTWVTDPRGDNLGTKH